MEETNAAGDRTRYAPILMNVAMISSVHDRCGVARYTKDLTEYLNDHATVRLLGLPELSNRQALDSLADQVRAADIVHIQYHPDYCGFWRFPVRLQRFCQFLRRIEIPRVVTVHDLTHTLPRRAHERVTLKSVAYDRLLRPVINRTAYGRFLRGRFLNHSDRVIVHTYASKMFLCSLGLDPERITVLYPGIPEAAEAEQGRIRELYGWHDRKILTIFGFVIPGKGYETVLDALARLPEEVVLLIAGGARTAGHHAYVDTLKASIAARDLDHRVAMTGYVKDEDVQPILRDSDVILLPYRQTMMTGVSYALSYALASRNPIVASDTPYFREIEGRYNAFKTFSSDNDVALAATIKSVLDGPRTSPDQGGWLQQAWTWKSVARRTWRIYRDVLERAHHEARKDLHYEDSDSQPVVQSRHSA